MRSLEGLFYAADVFCQQFELPRRQQLLSNGLQHRNQVRLMLERNHDNSLELRFAADVRLSSVPTATSKRFTSTKFA